MLDFVQVCSVLPAANLKYMAMACLTRLGEMQEEPTPYFAILVTHQYWIIDAELDRRYRMIHGRNATMD